MNPLDVAHGSCRSLVTDGVRPGPHLAYGRYGDAAPSQYSAPRRSAL